MKKGKRHGKSLGALLLSAAIICSAVLPAFAEEPDADNSDMGNPSVESLGAESQDSKPQDEVTQDSTLDKSEAEIQENPTEAEETSIESEGNSTESQKTLTETSETSEIQNEDVESSALLDSASASSEPADGKPRVTTESVTWEGGMLKIPVDLGDYNADDLEFFLWFKADDSNENQGSRHHIGHSLGLDGSFAVYSPLSWIELYDSDLNFFWTNQGNYEVYLEFRLIDGDDTLSYSKFTIEIPISSELWQAEEKSIKFDGNQDLIFSFKNGTNYCALQDIDHIQFSTGFDTINRIAYLEGDAVTQDMAGGTVTINKDVAARELKKVVNKLQQNGSMKNPPTHVYVEALAVTSYGEKIWFNTTKKDQDGMTVYYPAWELDLTEFDWTQEELKIVPEVTDYSYTKGDRDGATIKCTGALEDFESVYVDNVLVNPSNYTLESGSTILTFTTKYLNTLSAGKHTVTMNYTYGSVDTDLTVREKTNPGGSGTTSKPKPGKPVTPTSPTTSPTLEATTQPSGTTSVTTPTSTAAPSGTTAAAGAAVPSGTANIGNTSRNTSVQTGDDSSVMLWILAALFAFGTCGILVWKRCSENY